MYVCMYVCVYIYIYIHIYIYIYISALGSSSHIAERHASLLGQTFLSRAPVPAPSLRPGAPQPPAMIISIIIIIISSSSSSMETGCLLNSY